MGISLQRVEVTGTEPVTLAEMKSHLRVDFPDDDSLISSLITAARQRAENITGRCIPTSNWIYGLDTFPYGWTNQSAPARSGLTQFMGWWANAQTIRIPQAPLQSITSIQYIPGGGGSYLTLDPSTYTVDANSNPAVVFPIVNYYWPACYAVKNTVLISFVAGYGDNCPEDVKVAIRMLVAYWYENRQDNAVTPTVVNSLLSNYRSQPCGYVR
jgi:hypothetical protein